MTTAMHKLFGLMLIAGVLAAADASAQTKMDKTSQTLQTALLTWTKTTYLAVRQAEPRTAITALPCTISQGGSYYVAGDLVAGDGEGITITADDVTLDLNGFTLTGDGECLYNSAEDKLIQKNGIRVAGSGELPLRNVVIRNGAVRNFNVGLHMDDAVNCRVEGLTILDCGAQLHAVEQCSFDGLRSNGQRVDVNLRGDNNVFSKCAIMGDGSTAAGSTALFVDGDGNRVEDSRIGCVSENGILLDGQYNVVTGCDLQRAVDAGVYMIGMYNTVDGNRIAGCGVGIFRASAAGGNVIVRNTIMGSRNGNITMSGEMGSSDTIGTQYGGSSTLVDGAPFANIIK